MESISRLLPEQSNQGIRESILTGDTHEVLTGLPRDLVFILIKPLAMQNKDLSMQIMDELSKHGTIEFAQSRLVIDRPSIETHYSDSEGKRYYPPMVEYLTGQHATHFVLRDTLPIGARETSFAEYIRSTVIGPSHPADGSPEHIRNWAIQHGLPYEIIVDIPEHEQIDGCNDVHDNLVHCSDSTASALSEIANWYDEYPEVLQHYSDEFAAIFEGLPG